MMEFTRDPNINIHEKLGIGKPHLRCMNEDVFMVVKKIQQDDTDRDNSIVFTGSTSLALQGLLNRQINDIDILFFSEDIPDIVRHNAIKGISHDHYGGLKVKKYVKSVISLPNETIFVDAFRPKFSYKSFEKYIITKNIDEVEFYLADSEYIANKKLEIIINTKNKPEILKHLGDLMKLDISVDKIIDALDKSNPFRKKLLGLF